MKNKYIKSLSFLRLAAKVFPLKSKLNILISKYLYIEGDLVIPYSDGFSIVLKPESVATSTLNHLVFEGATYLPEFTLLNKIKLKLGKDFVAIDVGANIGTIIWQLAKDCKHIFAFEPIPKLNRIIEHSCIYNAFDRLTILKKAVGNMPGVVTMVDNDNSSIIDATSLNSIEVEVTTLDIALDYLEKIDFIKIDVEGFEWNVLQGARRLINQHKPILLLELHPLYLQNYGVDYNQVINFIESINYKIEYYSFMVEARKGKIMRLISRYFPNKGHRFINRVAFSKDTEKLPSILSYHLYCEYNVA